VAINILSPSEKPFQGSFDVQCHQRQNILAISTFSQSDSWVTLCSLILGSGKAFH
jgi:hypothetical protein